MLIILEGPDCAGKSTLAREIEEWLGQHAPVSMLHASAPKTHPLDAYVTPLLNYRPDTRHVVCDRWHLGEAVYPRVLGRRTRWNIAIERYLHLFMQSRGACVILLQPSMTELETRLQIRGDSLITLDMLDDITRAYIGLPPQYFNRRCINADSTDMLTQTRTPTPSSILRLARHLHLKAFFLNKFETYVGPPKPDVLLLGDERVDVWPPKMPAFVPYGTTSGHFLLSNLDVVEHNIGLANACDVDDPFELWQTLHEPYIVTLGRRASQRLDELKIPHASVPHPQFIRRFHHAHGDRYTRLITQIAPTGEDMLSWRP